MASYYGQQSGGYAGQQGGSTNNNSGSNSNSGGSGSQYPYGSNGGSYGQQQQQGHGFQQQQPQPSQGFHRPQQQQHHQQSQYQANPPHGSAYGAQWQQPVAPIRNQQQQQQPSFWNPATAATMVAMAGSGAAGMSNDAMFDLASSAGKSFLQSGTARMVPGVESTMQMLRHYFAVDNRYVQLKMRKILFPFFDKQWARVVSSFLVLDSCQLFGMVTQL
jgi:hypothetical protein